VKVPLSPHCVSFEDRWAGHYSQDLTAEVGDFIIRRADGYWAYQLAVVVDDGAQGITDIVRGVDLLDSTPRQLYLQQVLGLPQPATCMCRWCCNARRQDVQANRRHRLRRRQRSATAVAQGHAAGRALPRPRPAGRAASTRSGARHSRMGALIRAVRRAPHFSWKSNSNSCSRRRTTASCCQHPLLAAPARVQQLRRYFDTPDLHLMRHGAGLRVRKEDGEWMQTMKAGGSVQSGLHSRNEWEGPVAVHGRAGQAGGDRCTLAGHAGCATISRTASKPLFLVEQRHLWEWNAATASRWRWTSATSSARRQGALNEIELELKDGEPATCSRWPCNCWNDSRYASPTSTRRSAAMLCARPARPHARTGAAADATLDAARRRHAGQLPAAHPAQRSAVVEATIRKRCTRCASACAACVRRSSCSQRGALPARCWKTIAGWAWNWARRATGTCCSATLARVQASPGGPAGLHDLPALVQQQVAAHRQQAAQALLSPRYTRLLLQMGQWLLEPEAAHGMGEETGTSAAEFSHHTMQRLRKTLLKRARRMNDTDAASVHRTRIAAAIALCAGILPDAVSRQSPAQISGHAGSYPGSAGPAQ
jgi:hypothetical protein